MVFGGKAAFPQGFSRADAWDFPGFYLVFPRGGVTKNLVLTWVLQGILVRAREPLVLTWGNPGFYQFSRQTDKSQGKIGFPGKILGFPQVKCNA